jgi:hypothetical protein
MSFLFEDVRRAPVGSAAPVRSPSLPGLHQKTRFFSSRSSAASLEVVSPYRVSTVRALAWVWVPKLPSCPFGFSARDSRVFAPVRCSGPISQTVAPLMGLHSSSECSSWYQRPLGASDMTRLLPHDSLPRGLCPFSVFPHRAAALLMKRSTTSSPCTFRFSKTAWRFNPPRACMALFRASSTLGVLPFRALLRSCSRSPLSSVVALLPFTPLLAQRPRPQGFAPHECPPLRTDGLDRYERVALLGFTALQGISLLSLAAAFTATSLLDSFSVLATSEDVSLTSPCPSGATNREVVARHSRFDRSLLVCSWPTPSWAFLPSDPRRSFDPAVVRESPPQASRCVTVR